MTIYFDEDSAYWTNDNTLNEHFLNCKMDYIIEIIKHRGYIYLNQIYENLGIEWDTRCGNLCLENPNCTVVIGWEDKNNRWSIDIY